MPTSASKNSGLLIVQVDFIDAIWWKSPATSLNETLSASAAPTTQYFMVDLSALPESCHCVGIFGGTFNPIHCGHMAVAQCALQQCELDAVLWIPAGLPPHKPLASGASNRQRLEMVRLAIAEYPQFYWSDVELRRPGRSFAIDTIEQCQSDYPWVQQWSWIIGADAIADLPTWHRATEVAGCCEWIVAPRPDTATDRLLERLEKQLPDLKAKWISGVELAVSSSDIRQRLRNGQAIADLVPTTVNTYLKQRHLYTE
ncbi:MAG: nicotinate-nucleotide adenylyltransferase [Synechococcus sp.]